MMQTDSTASVAHPHEAVPADTVSGASGNGRIAPALPVGKGKVKMSADTAAVETADSVSADSVSVVKEYGVTLQPPQIPHVAANGTPAAGMSFVVGGIVLLFCVIGFHFRNNRKYVTSMARDLLEVRVRSNAFDDTVRETSFLVLLNLLWSCSAGILLYGLLSHTIASNDPAWSSGLDALATHRAASMGICMGVSLAYTCFMALSYMLVGTVFTDRDRARLWVKGFTSGQGFLSIIFFVLALLLLSHAAWGVALLWVAAGAFTVMKIVFIWKGFRIFFTQISSWVLFLYYLCSLEIVPLILTYLAAVLLCGFL